MSVLWRVIVVVVVVVVVECRSKLAGHGLGVLHITLVGVTLDNLSMHMIIGIQASR